jgi:hypothetical protein
MKNQKKSVMGEIVSVFVLVLVIAILAGLTFLFVSNLKTQAVDSAPKTSVSVTLEEISAENLATGVSVDGTSALGAGAFTLTGLLNATSDEDVITGNATLTSLGVITNNTDMAAYVDGFKVNYTYTYIAADDANAYTAINSTESSGAGIVTYLPLIFIALIFGAILTLVLKIILPYINLGKDMGGF